MFGGIACVENMLFRMVFGAVDTQWGKTPQWHWSGEEVSF
jgi:hypothetical protein